MPLSQLEKSPIPKLSEIKHFNYSGSNIAFQIGSGDVMVNATEMSKPFGKRPAKWLELPSTINFLTELEAIRFSDRLIKTENGVGTWMHEDVALEFARWLSPAFAIWCNDKEERISLTDLWRVSGKVKITTLKNGLGKNPLLY